MTRARATAARQVSVPMASSARHRTVRIAPQLGELEDDRPRRPRTR